MTSLEQHCTVMDGVLTIKKEAGWTSHDVVAKIRHMLGGARVGHAGTLDPAATGLLPLLIGRGTRIAEYLMEWDKEYRGTLRLGETTDTQDATGTVLTRRGTNAVTDAAIREAAGRFRGALEQIPPMYSAVKVAGVPLYKSARAGETISRAARTVVIHALDILVIEGRDVRFRAVCSKGTYVRTLCADLGAALGVGGHLLTLERTRVGPLVIEQAVTVEEAGTRHALGRLDETMMSLDEALQRFAAVRVDEHMAARVRHGAPVPFSQLISPPGVEDEPRPGMPLRVQDADGRLLAIGRYPMKQGGPLTIDKVLISHG